MSNQLTHLDEYGKASMVNISSKTPMLRTALAEGLFCAKAETIDAILRSDLPKGEALAVARVSGIQAAKQCGNLIPLCHPLPIEYVDVQFEKISDCTIRIRSTVVVTGRTGIEMEALTAVSVSALTLWDMTKAIDDSLVIKEITLVEKTKELVD
ncbi:MAG: cyclic pyranopterin monophosphate synthase MoaC [Phycisphaerae bacterium]|jgi:cyclic pyranopterin phosphate synthase|nr:cyclic pyranopterin monophosphate synthase MoaC [Phycisphaerae bacterium]MBT5409482.1 cyclic pyranopterin monophosphate synthase MoaC [Phycisphaerae bacterium]MBT7657857.1 cyclic pyranopterin monophosphate synthase MoaC [Phycisphaerae bacterium]|tara:strand:+ start:1521 stop:1982 length:462 start_codon:yes stop_codon:yes gene_type:complete